MVRGKIPTTDNIVIVDIDEKSLYHFGQWPWSRNIMAKIIQNLTDAGVAAIGLDIVFAERDRTSPSIIFKKFHLNVNNAPDYDKIFIETIKNSPSILGYEFQLENSNFLREGDINIPAIIIEKHKPKNLNPFITAKGVVLNFKELQDAAYSSGFFNSIPDEDGIIRKVPLLIRYKGQLYPSLSLELLRALIGSDTIIVNYSDLGIMNLQIGDFKIPTDRLGRFIINFRGPKKSFKYLSAVDIYNNNFDKNLLKNKIVLIGTTSAGLFDLKSTPFESVFPGVEVHANIIDNILQGDFLTYPYWIDTANLVILFILIFTTIYLLGYSPFWISPVILLTITNLFLFTAYYLLFTKGIIIDIFLPLLAIFISALFAIFLDYILEIKQEDLIKAKFASKVSKEVMEDILKHLDENTLAAKKREITILFSDIRNFTKISETLKDAKLVIEFLNRYMNPMTNIIIDYHGTVDKYIGDAIMAYWNAPREVENHTVLAVESSLKQLYKVKELNEEFKKDKKFQHLAKKFEEYKLPVLDIGIGLNRGEAVVGEMGSTKRSDYTAIGDSVNLASRLESLCKYYNSKLNISNFVKEKLDEEKYIFRFLDLVTVKGKNEPVEIWQIIDYNTEYLNLIDMEREVVLKELKEYHKAIKLYKKAKFKEALKIFEELNRNPNKTNNKIYDIYIERCSEYIKNPPKNFNGVFVHTTKG